jgi:SecD/SecF fusion protein
MQFKGVIRFFTALLIIVCLLQLSYSVFVRQHEGKLKAKVAKQMSAYPKPEAKYPNASDALAKAQYKDFRDSIEDALMRVAEDSTKNKVITYGVEGKVTYGEAKKRELNLGLDLQGGVAVTLEVGVGELLKKRSLNPNDEGLKKAIDIALDKKAKTGRPLADLFAESYKEAVPNGKLAPLYADPSKNKFDVNATDATVINWLKTEIAASLESTREVLGKRINKFGVASTSLNLDEEKGTLSVELPGVKDFKAVRNSLQATAKLQFWEVFNNKQDAERLQPFFTTVDAAVLAYQRGDSVIKIDTSNKERPFTGLFKGNSQPGGIGDILISDENIFKRYLKIPGVQALLPGDAKLVLGKSNLDTKNPKNPRYYGVYMLKRPVSGSDDAFLEGDKVTQAKADFDPTTGKPVVSLQMNDQGSQLWASLTKRVAASDGFIAITLDDFVYSAPNCDEEIKGGNTQISGNFTPEETEELSSILKTGKLDASATIVQEQVVGPSLGEEAVRGGLMSFVISFGIIFLLMLLYYNTSGWVANIALILNLLFTVGVLSAIGFSLTAAGIAGLVLTIGMAVDTNVIIFERIKEELNSGKSYEAAVDEGYKRSLPPVIDAHVTSLLTAAILYIFGTGAVLGFATTQIIGILLSLFCGILVSRLITDVWTNKKRHFQYFTGISRKIFKHASYKFIEYRKIAYIISAVVLLAGVGAFFYGFDQGVEYKGGRSYVVDFRPARENNTKAANVSLSNIRTALKTTFNDNVVVKTVDKASQLDITTSYLMDKAGTANDSIVEAKLFEGLKNYLPENTTFQKFNSVYKKGSKKVEASISSDLKAGAWKSTLIAVLIITLYIFIRFRDWRYSIGTIIALAHDVLVTLAVFSFFRHIMPFPLEIDQHFIAAVLTVAGFSMNDTVIVFDRVREYARKKVGASKTEIINTAINDTLSRTIMTSLTVFITILILFIFGGEVTRGFAFAMLVGVITGTYSSIFVAAPILIDFAKHKPLGKSAAEDYNVEDDPTVMK